MHNIYNYYHDFRYESGHFVSIVQRIEFKYRNNIRNKKCHRSASSCAVCTYITTKPTTAVIVIATNNNNNITINIGVCNNI